MADNNNNNDKPSKGDEGNKKPIVMNDEEKLCAEMIRLHDLDDLNEEQWASIARGHGMSVSAVQEQWAALKEKFLDVTKDEVPTEVVPKRRTRGGKSGVPTPRTMRRAAPVLQDEDNELDDGDDVPALRFPRPSQTRPSQTGPRPQRRRFARGIGRPRASQATSEVGGQAPPPVGVSDNTGPRPAPNDSESIVETAPEETAPDSPPRRSPSPAESSFNLSPEEEDEMRQRLAFAHPMSAVYSEWWLIEARRRWAEEHPGQYLPGEGPDDKEDQPEQQD